MAAGIKIRYERSDVQPGLQAYGLKVTVLEATDMPKEIFIMRRDVEPANTPMTAPDPTDPGIAPDTFICIADPVDLEEVPALAPDPLNEMPYYRVEKVEFWFRTPIILEETYGLIAQDITKLVESMKSLATIDTTEDVIYA